MSAKLVTILDDAIHMWSEPTTNRKISEVFHQIHRFFFVTTAQNQNTQLNMKHKSSFSRDLS